MCHGCEKNYTFIRTNDPCYEIKSIVLYKNVPSHAGLDHPAKDNVIPSRQRKSIEFEGTGGRKATTGFRSGKRIS